MSLYGDLPQAKNSSTSATTNWPGLGKGQLANKVLTAFQPPPSLLRAAVLGSNVNGRGGGRATTQLNGRGRGLQTQSATDISEHGTTTSGPAPVASSIFLDASGAPIRDEYDPNKPNDYEAIVRERERRREEAETRERQAEIDRARRREEEDRSKAEVEAAAAAAARATVAAAAASTAGSEEPSKSAMEEYEAKRARLGMSGEEAFRRRAMMSSTGTGSSAPAPAPEAAPADAEGASSGPGSFTAPKGMTLAQKLMEKMGWREGEGLGRNSQGISAPLVAQKVGKGAGVIVAGESNKLPPPPPLLLPPAVSTPSPNGGPPSRVICMRNMVRPGEVDAQLEEEIGEELTKYGAVADVLIFEVTSPGYSPEEAVRIFVKFEVAESAARASADLQGRFFGGRTVRVSFFPEERFNGEDLAPRPGEFEQ